MAVCLAVPASAQTFGGGTVHGRVVDETGGSLPGVSVTAHSSSLRLPWVVALTDADGEYQLKTLPPGTYDVEYELSGFQKIIRQNMSLNARFDARLDVTLKVGSVTDTVTVTGQRPVFDVTSTMIGAVLTRDTLDDIPTSKSLAESIALAPGVRYSGAIDVGGSRTAASGTGGTNFGSTQQSPFLEGVNVRLFEGGSQAYIDQRSLEEIQVSTVGNDAEVGPPGIAWIGTVKSGRNQFHGLGSGEFQRPELQSGNVDDALKARGVNPAGSSIKYYWDLSGSLGGRLVRDRAWFFSAERHIRRVANVVGFARTAGPDNKFGTADDVPSESPIDNTDQTLKLSYQMTNRYRIIGFIQRSLKHEFTRNAGPLFPYEATWDYSDSPKPHKVGVEAAIGTHIFFDALYGRSYATALWRDRKSVV